MSRRLPPKGDFQPHLFSANFADIPIRDQRDTMERPFFSLSKKPRLTPIEYRVGDIWVEVTANPKFGMATIWDADILIWAATQITEAGTVSTVLVFVSVAAAPPAGAAFVSVTVQVPEAFGPKLAGQANEDTRTGATKLIVTFWETLFSVAVNVAL